RTGSLSIRQLRRYQTRTFRTFQKRKFTHFNLFISRTCLVESVHQSFIRSKISILFLQTLTTSQMALSCLRFPLESRTSSEYNGSLITRDFNQINLFDTQL